LNNYTYTNLSNNHHGSRVKKPTLGSQTPAYIQFITVTITVIQKKFASHRRMKVGEMFKSPTKGGGALGLRGPL
jgi:hypothetical protein